jgi:hypothetical protein
MGNVIEVDPGDSFIFRVWKTLTTNPAVKWVNTYEARFLDVGSTEDLMSLADGLAAFESELALTTTLIERTVISTWVPDSRPYNPSAFLSLVQNVSGQVAFVEGQQVDLRICLRLTREVLGGFQGKIDLRNSLLSTQLTSEAGTYSLIDQPGMEAAVSSAMSVSGLNTNLADSLGQPKLAMIGTGESTRFITGIKVKGVSIIPLNHKYFDRAP